MIGFDRLDSIWMMSSQKRPSAAVESEIRAAVNPERGDARVSRLTATCACYLVVMSQPVEVVQALAHDLGENLGK